MTGKEYLYAYCQLKLHGYTHEEAQEIIEDIKIQMKKDNSKKIPSLNNADKGVLEMVKELSDEN